MSMQFYEDGLSKVDSSKLMGKLIVLEGPDGSGRSTQIEMISRWLESEGHFVENVGIKRSMLVSEELAEAQSGNILSRRTMSLFYATDFADQLENKMIPALKAGAIVLADRYFYTLMARDMVRGASLEWLEKLFGFAIVPDIVFYLKIAPDVLIERNLANKFQLNYWESGMDLGLADNIYDSFIDYQIRMHGAFIQLQKKYHFHIVDGNHDPNVIFQSIKTTLEGLIRK